MKLPKTLSKIQRACRQSWACRKSEQGPWAEPDAAPGTLHVEFTKDDGVRLGAKILAFRGHAIISNVGESGLFNDWNKRNPDMAVTAGDVIATVNGREGAWDIIEELSKSGSMKLAVLRNGQSECSDRAICTIRSLDSVRAGDVDIDQCAICMESVGVDEQISHLSCGHGYHTHCIGRWYQTGKQGCKCPLCIRDIF